MAKILYVYNDQVYANVTATVRSVSVNSLMVWVMRIPSGTKQSLL